MEHNNPNLLKPLYSVIVLLYNRTDELRQMSLDCIASVNNSIDKSKTEVIIVDNGSTVREDWSKYCDTYVRLHTNTGCSRGWNAGLLMSRGYYKCVLGDDTIVHKGFLEALQAAMDMPDCGVGQIHVEHLPQGIGIVENYKWPSGACFMLTQHTIDKVGLFDQDTYFPANYEDLDYWLRCYKAGLKMYRNFSFSIQHREGATLHAPDISQYSDDNKRRFIRKFGRDYSPVFFSEEYMPTFTA